MDNGRVVCALLDGQICSAYFNMRHLDDFLVFVWTWTRTNVHKDPPAQANTNNTNTSSAKESVGNNNNQKKQPLPPPSDSERISFFINAHINSLILDVDLAPISFALFDYLFLCYICIFYTFTPVSLTLIPYPV